MAITVKPQIVNKGSLGLATVHKLEGLSSEKILQTKENRKFEQIFKTPAKISTNFNKKQ